jgi:hypothetical protein
MVIILLHDIEQMSVQKHRLFQFNSSYFSFGFKLEVTNRSTLTAHLTIYISVHKNNECIHCYCQKRTYSESQKCLNAEFFEAYTTRLGFYTKGI